MINFITENYFFLLLFGTVLTILGAYQNFRIEKIKKNGIKTNGQIVEYIAVENKNTDSYNKIMYHAVVKFNDKKGKSRSIIHGFGTSFKPNITLPKKVDISYLEENDKIEIIILNHNGLNIFAMIVLILGLLTLITTPFIYFS